MFFDTHTGRLQVTKYGAACAEEECFLIPTVKIIEIATDASTSIIAMIG